MTKGDLWGFRSKELVKRTLRTDGLSRVENANLRKFFDSQ